MVHKSGDLLVALPESQASVQHPLSLHDLLCRHSALCIPRAAPPEALYQITNTKTASSWSPSGSSSRSLAHFATKQYQGRGVPQMVPEIRQVILVGVISVPYQLQPGDVISLNVLGRTIIVLGSEKAASELLDKRSAIYSDRPSFPIFER
jgi:hypothetical protein